MKKIKLPITKIIILAIAILVPLLAGYFIASYSYKRYRPFYYFEYMEKVEENTQKKLEAYLDYYTYSYDATPYYEEVVKKDGETVLKFSVYRIVLTKVKNDSITYDLKYAFVVYDVNYEKLIEIEDPSGEKTLEYNNLPQIYLNIQDNEYNGNSVNLTMDFPQDTILINDYNSSPEVDSKDRKLSRYLKWADAKIDPSFSDDITVKVFMGDPDDGDVEEREILSFNKKDFYQVIEQVDDTHYTKGANNNPEDAGYFAHVLKTKIWWQSLIAIILVGLVTVSFYIVWKAEDAYKKEVKGSKK